MARLGEILVARRACAAEKVREGLEGQVIYGGRVGTNLLELGSVSEEDLALALAQQHGCPSLWGEILVEPRALDLLRPEVADRLDAVPLRLEGRRLSVVTADPRDLHRLDEISFATGKEVRPVAVAQSRLWELLRRHYGLVRPERGVVAAASRARPAAARPADAPGAPAADLMDEEAFNALYDNFPPPVSPPGAPGPHRAPPPGLVAPPAGASSADAFRGSLVSTEEVLAALQQEAEQGADRPQPIAIRLTPPGGIELPPLSFADAARELAGVQERGAIARIVLRCCRSRLRRAVLLTVRDRFADGWDGIGEGLSPHAVARIHVALDQPGVFQTVVDSRAHFLGPLQKTEANVRFLRALGGGAPRTSFAMPVLARGEVVNVLYADNGRGQLVDSDGVGELLILATKISQSYDLLLARAG